MTNQTITRKVGIRVKHRINIRHPDGFVNREIPKLIDNRKDGNFFVDFARRMERNEIFCLLMNRILGASDCAPYEDEIRKKAHESKETRRVQPPDVQ